MRFTQLKLTGFKSFVDPTELRIDAGLTGVIGPNGCGKSNLLEALRWVMGATSAKSLRGSGMEDVIFAGTDARAAREHAEVKLTIDNQDRRAPAQFNDAELLEVVRRITRGKGSHYKINGEEVRAKDVQLLFADAGTGANSPALVRQGQISELINAKPENRRRVLEEAAGVAGLRARRREAQLRLNAAETNLARLQEIVEDLDNRYAALQRQAKQAGRYRDLSQNIRAFESLLWLRRWREAGEALAKAESAVKDAEAEAEKAMVAAAVANKESEAAHAQVQPLREKEAEAAAALRHAERLRDQLDRDVVAAREAIERLTSRVSELEIAEAREAELHGEAEQALYRLKNQLSKLAEESGNDAAAQARAEAVLSDADTARAEAERKLDAAAAACSDIRARREAARRDAHAARSRLERLEAEAAKAREAIEAFEGEAAPDLSALEAQHGELEADARAAQRSLEQAEAALEQAREAADAAREAARSARSDLDAMKTERKSLERFLASGAVEDQALDAVRAEAGYEQALAVSLGEDLEASLDDTAPRRWAGGGAAPDALPEGATPLADRVSAPDVLSARLQAVGVVEDEAALTRLTPQLKPGQRLVTRDGALRRWDGFAVEAGAPSPAAARLETRNRLAELEDAASGLEDNVSSAEATRIEAAEAVQEAERNHSAARGRLREADQALRATEGALADARAEAARAEARKAGLNDALERAEARLESAREECAKANAEREAAEAADDGAEALEAARSVAEKARGRAADARAALETVKREAQGRRHRIAALEREQADWLRREQSAGERLTAIRTQKADAAEALDAARSRPDELEAQRPALLDALSDAEKAAAAARDAVAEAEIGQRETDSALRAAEKLAAEAREARAAAQARLTAARERVEETGERLHDATGESPETLEQRAKNSEYAALSSGELERRLDEARLTRERLGAVNLRADEEAGEIDAERTRLKTERDDLTEAVARLRKAVDTLSREGRARLMEAFEVVDAHFQRLFQTLFGGGRAELALTESDDPLEAGLEIYACPPGKKMETMSLMSGGEQALTATALIFAVFLSNPAPVCVLDEVDAPLDDANVDRYCTMLDEMKRLTETRFLVITHNPVTMSRMDRLFGVTMGERGVSQLVSVNLRAAEAMLAAE
ncbi:MAG: AAA family ATPase [Alphaproteobacteria bacterium]|nr:AAA family ATPase [Alphaproteobacteria bacterium]